MLSLLHPSVAARLSPRPIRQSYVPPPLLSWTRRRVEPASTASTTATQSRSAASSAPDPASSTATPPPGRPGPRQSTGEYSPEARHMRPSRFSTAKCSIFHLSQQSLRVPSRRLIHLLRREESPPA